MLDEKDLQALQAIMTQQKQEIQGMMTQQKQEIQGMMAQQKQEVQGMMAQQKQEIQGMMAQQKQEIQGMMAQQKQEILKESAANMQVIIENVVNPQFQILAEAVQGINRHLESMPTAEDLEITSSRIDTLEAIVKRLSRDVANLKKAQ